LNYQPNLDALKIILEEINPQLLQRAAFKYKIIICGKNLPDEFRELDPYRNKNILFGGFTEDIGTFYKASDLFINPVIKGGGVKTKVVEAIGYGTTVISTVTGSSGMIREACGEKLVTVSDKDWKSFVTAIIENTGVETRTPSSYYDHYYWGNIVNKFKHL
jgi:glycosyltransferase involved in cell wall biosynthesis